MGFRATPGQGWPDINSVFRGGRRSGAGIDLLPQLAYARASTSGYENSAGRILSAADNVWFDNFDAGQLMGRPLFEALENLVIRSNEFDNAAWTKTNCSVTTGVDDGEGGTTAFTVSATAANAALQRSETAATGQNTGGFWIRRRTGTGAISYRVGELSPVVAINPTSQWRRLPATANSLAAPQRLAIIIGTSGDEVDIKHAQMNPGFTLGPYMPTGAARATRARDEAQLTGGAFTALWPSASQGAIFVEAIAGGDPANRHLLDITDGTTANRIQLAVNGSNQVYASVTTGGVAQGSVLVGAAISANGLVRAALRMQDNNLQLAVNGVLATADTVCTMPTVTQLHAGSNFTRVNTTYWNGWLRKLNVMAGAPSNEALQIMTAV